MHKEGEEFQGHSSFSTLFLCPLPMSHGLEAASLMTGLCLAIGITAFLRDTYHALHSIYETPKVGKRPLLTLRLILRAIQHHSIGAKLPNDDWR